MIYIIKTEHPLGNEKHQASYYVGYANDDTWNKRLMQHLSGKGSAFTRAAKKAGYGLTLMALIEGDRYDERRIKNAKSTPRIVDMLKRGKTPRCIKGQVLFVQ